jgi:hypothetical protein
MWNDGAVLLAALNLVGYEVSVARNCSESVELESEKRENKISSTVRSMIKDVCKKIISPE